MQLLVTKFLFVKFSLGYIRSYLEYVVWYRQSDVGEWRTMRLSTGQQMETTISNLEPGREYEFMVLSQDRYGDGMFSKSFKYFTKRKKFFASAY